MILSALNFNNHIYEIHKAKIEVMEERILENRVYEIGLILQDQQN